MVSHAQAKNVKISGKVTDFETGSPIAGVSIVIQNSAIGTRTDAEGNFFLNIEVGKKYAIEISNVGYQTKVVTDVEVTDLNNPGLMISLQKVNLEMTNVVVTSSARRESVASLYSIQKNSSSISDGISADMIKRSPDKTTGDVLKRVSGASVQDHKFVIIRGLNERYNVSLLNNSVLPSTEADKKAFAFDIIPSSVIDNLIIYKSATPDLPGDFSGGAIKILTKDYPSTRISEASISFGYNSLTTAKNFYKGYPNGSLDAIGFFGNSRLIPGPYYRNKNGFILKNSDFKREVTKLFPGTFGYEPANQSLPNISVSYTGGNTTLFKNGNKLGYIYSIGYSNGRAVSEKERSDFDIVKRFLYDYNTSGYDQKNNVSALLNLAYSYGRSKISFKNLFNNNFVKTVGIRSGANYENGINSPFYIKSANSEASGNGLVNSVMEGLHKLNSDWTVDWNASFGFTYKYQPDQKIVSFRSPENDNGDYYLRLSNENSPEIRNAGRVYSFLDEFIYGASANATKEFMWLNQTQKLKFGSMNYYRNRTVEVDALGYASLDFYGVTIPETKSTSFNSIFSPANIDNYNLTVANIETNSTDYTGHALLNAGYLMMDNRFSDKFKLTWGTRIERYYQELSATGKGTKTYDNTDVLPSFLFTYALNKKTNLRIAGSQAVNRPEFRELADYSVFDYDNYLTVRGNPDLKRCKNTNADIRYEWFPASGEIISASLFFKYFSNPIEQINKGNDVLSYENAEHAKAYGAEIEIRKKLDFIDIGFFRHLAFYTNASYIKGSVRFDGLNINSPLQGESPYVINGGLTYTSDNDDLAFNILYNRIGPRLKFRSAGGAVLNIFENSRDLLDFQVTKKLLDNKLEARLTVSDILAQPYSWYYKYDADASNTNYNASTDKIISTVKYGTSINLSIRYNLGK
jgi:hypothetical protein